MPVSRRLVAQKGDSCSSAKREHVSTCRLVAQKKRFNCSSEDKGELEGDYFPVQSSYFQHLPGKTLASSGVLADLMPRMIPSVQLLEKGTEP